MEHVAGRVGATVSGMSTARKGLMRVKNALLRLIQARPRFAGRLSYPARAWGLFAVEMTVLVLLLGLLLQAGVGRARCWDGNGTVRVLQRYYQVGQADPEPLGADERRRLPADADVRLKIELQLRKECYCPDGNVSADVHTFQIIVGKPWPEIRLGGTTLQPQQWDRDSAILEGPLSRYPPGDYKVETWLKCTSRPGELYILDFAKFVLQEESTP
jgi:hypothetical protein